MGLLGVFLAILIVGISLVNAAIPLAAWGRSRDPRFLLLVGAYLALAVLGGLWAWGQLPVSPPSFTQASLPELAVTLLAVVLLLVATLSPRRT